MLRDETAPRGPRPGRRHGAGEFSGKTVAVTGASRGIGAAVARQLDEAGARVGLIATSQAGLVEVSRSLTGAHHGVAADLTDPSECQRAIREIDQALGPVDVLISNAGMLRRDFVESVVPADFEQTYRLHVGAAIWLAQAVLPGMRQRRYGRIVLVSSELGLIGGPSYASYCTSKWAMVGLNEVLQHELAGSGVRCCVVCPGDVRTDQLIAEHEWGPTGGTPPDKAMAADYVTGKIVDAARGRRPVVVLDRPHMRLSFALLRRMPRWRVALVRSAFKDVIGSRKLP